MLWLVIGFGIGCAIVFSFPLKLIHMIAIGGAAITLLLSHLIFLRKLYLIKWLSLFILMIAFGSLYSQLYIQKTTHPILHEEIGPTRIFGTVDKFTKVGPNQYRFILKNVSVPELNEKKLPFKIRLNYRTKRDADFKPNDRILAFSKIYPIAPPSYPGGFAFQKFLYFKKIGATGYIMGNARTVKSKNKPLSDFASSKFREKIQAIMKPHLSPSSYEIAAALFTGERNQIAPEIMDNIRHSGLAHLLAISGLHVGLVAGLALFVMRYSLAAIPNFGLFFPIKKFAALGAILATGLYVYIVDAPVSAQRALVMIWLLLFSFIINRNTLTLRFIAIAALIVLLFAPYSVLDAGFQMSFAAVTALVAFYENYSNEMLMHESLFSRIKFYFWGIMITSIIATFATLSFTIYHFHQFIPLGVISNLIAIPITAFIIMPLGVLAIILSPIHFEFIPLKLLDWGIQIILKTADLFANSPFSVIHIPQMPSWGFAFCGIGLIWLFLWKTTLRYIFIPFLVVGILSPYLYKKPDILIAPNLNQLAILNGDKMQVSSKQKSRFTRMVWREAYGFEKINEVKIPFINNQFTFKNHVLMFEPGEKLMIDHQEISKQNDAISIYFHKNSYTIKNNTTSRGDRPWIPLKREAP